MVHVRLNERETNPNPHINFITPLPIRGAAAAEEGARQLLRALAAQVKPVMRAHGLTVNSLEEYEYNRVFAGRNWNNGEVVEIVLRGAHGIFQPTSWLMSTLCHELAHIKHMNHGREFQALWVQLRREVRELQIKGYYGDGYWSSGTRLADSVRVGGQGTGEDELPEYMCGGAHSRARPSNLRRRRHHRPSTEGPSKQTGRQTARKRKAGSRVTTKGLFESGGRTLNEDIEDEADKKAGSSFRKRAGSKRAREERALAIERRLAASRLDHSQAHPEPNESGTDSESERASQPIDPETDQDRRRVLLESVSASDAEGLKASAQDYTDDFVLPASNSSLDPPQVIMQGPVPANPSSSDGKGKGRATDVAPLASGRMTTAKSSKREVLAIGSPKAPAIRPLTDFFASRSTAAQTWDGPPPQKEQKTGSLMHGSFSQAEHRKSAALDMLSGSSRTLAAGTFDGNELHAGPKPPRFSQEGGAQGSGAMSACLPDGSWICLVCTLSNESTHLACSACATPRGESVWKGHPT